MVTRMKEQRRERFVVHPRVHRADNGFFTAETQRRGELAET
jgi:hypothetical protein